MKNRIALVILPALLLVACMPVLGQEEKKHQAGDIEIEKRTFKSSSGTTFNYQVGTFYVKENRSNPNSRVIGLGFARFPAPNSKSPPVFFLPGGPGGSFLNADPSKIGRTGGPLLAEELLGRCDLVFVDQRGYSKRGVVLNKRSFKPSPIKPDSTNEYRVKESKRFARQVVERYSKTDVDLRGYTVLECIEDVHELRKKLGYKKITLRGQSFGSQWSFGILKKYPETVERALLTGVEPLDHAYDMPSHVFAAVKRVWKTIDQDPKFKPYLPPGGMAEAAETVIKRLETEPIKVIPKGKSKPVQILGPDDFPWSNPTMILELYHGQLRRWTWPRFSMIVPRTLIQPLIDSSLGVTPERKKKLWNDPAVRYLSRRNFDYLMATAEIWPSPDVGDDFRTPKKCDVPVVFVNGDWDYKTPVENMHEIFPYFPNGHKVVVHRAGHGTVTPSMKKQHPKFISKLAQFLESGETKGLPKELTVRPSKTFKPPKFKVESNDKGK